MEHFKNNNKLFWLDPYVYFHVKFIFSLQYIINYYYYNCAPHLFGIWRAKYILSMRAKHFFKICRSVIINVSLVSIFAYAVKECFWKKRFQVKGTTKNTILKCNKMTRHKKGSNRWPNKKLHFLIKLQNGVKLCVSVCVFVLHLWHVFWTPIET